MAYFLKKTKRNDRLYLSIYESFYSPETKNTKHKSYKSLGFVDKLVSQGIDDPISHFQKEVDALNLKHNTEKVRRKSKQISEMSPMRYLGYLPLAKVMNLLDMEDHFEYMAATRRFHFSIYELFTALVYARAVNPCSKWKTYHDIFPHMIPDYSFSYDQVLDGLDFLGSEYEKFVEIMTVATKDNFGIDTSRSYFDCTNFYFEIDKESLLQKKGPSKENRRDPIVGMGLLLDANLLPIGMKIYPGNESEKPVLRDVIKGLKQRNNIEGRTIQIADKGLNCAANIIQAVNNGDGYLFSKSVKQLPAKEKEWVFNENDYETITDENGQPLYRLKSCIDKFTYSYTDKDGRRYTKTVKEKRVATYNFKLARKKNMEIDRMVNKARNMKMCQAKKEEYGESARYVSFVDKDGKKATPTINQEAIDKDRKAAGYNMLITSEIKMSSEEIHRTYHQLWRIEESFRIMKSEIDARPVYLQTENRIIGHFLVCYASVLAERLLQFNLMEDRYSASELFDFIRKFTVTRSTKNTYINNLCSSDLVKDLADTLSFPITNFYLTDKQIKMMHHR